MIGRYEFNNHEHVLYLIFNRDVDRHSPYSISLSKVHNTDRAVHKH